MAHIHRGAKGTNGPVIVPLDKNGDTYSVPAGRKLTAEQMKDLKAGNLYVNVHTAKNKGGEVRGQLQSLSSEAPRPSPRPRGCVAGGRAVSRAPDPPGRAAGRGQRHRQHRAHRRARRWRRSSASR